MAMSSSDSKADCENLMETENSDNIPCDEHLRFDVKEEKPYLNCFFLEEKPNIAYFAKTIVAQKEVGEVKTEVKEEAADLIESKAPTSNHLGDIGEVKSSEVPETKVPLLFQDLKIDTKDFVHEQELNSGPDCQGVLNSHANYTRECVKTSDQKYCPSDESQEMKPYQYEVSLQAILDSTPITSDDDIGTERQLERTLIHVYHKNQVDVTKSTAKHTLTGKYTLR